MTSSGPLSTQQAKIRPSEGWVFLGALLVVGSCIMLVMACVRALADIASSRFSPTVVEVSDHVQMTLDPNIYRVYTPDFGQAVVTVTGDDGQIELSNATPDAADYQSQSWQSSTRFTIDTSGTYLISNVGRTTVGVAPDVQRPQNANPLPASSLVTGAALGIPGYIILAVSTTARRRSRKRSREAARDRAGPEGLVNQR